MRRFHLVAAMALSIGSLAMAGCATLSSALTNPVAPLTVAQAEQAATLAWQIGATYVATFPQTPAHAAQEKALSDALHAALVNFENATAANSSAASAAFSSALAAYKAYTTPPAPTTAATPPALA